MVNSLKKIYASVGPLFDITLKGILFEFKHEYSACVAGDIFIAKAFNFVSFLTSVLCPYS